MRTGLILSAVTMAGIAMSATSAGAALVHAVNVDFNNGASATYSGTAASSDTGTTWNGIGVANPPVVSPALLDSTGTATALTFTTVGGSGNFTAAGGTVANPAALMTDYRVIRTNSVPNTTFTVTIAGFDAASAGDYKLYVYAGGDTAGQGATISVDLANQLSGGVSTAATTGASRDITAGLGVAYQVLDATVTAGGTLTFSASVLTGQSFGGVNGFQLVGVPEPTGALAATAAFAALGLGRRKFKR